MAKFRNEYERRARFEKYFKLIDKNESGWLSYDEFKTFLTQYNKKELPEKQNEFFFHGSDVYNDDKICKEDLWQLVEAFHNNDKLYINKLFFRAIDIDRSLEIDASELSVIVMLNSVDMTGEEIEEAFDRAAGGKSRINFAQMYKIVTGEDIPYDTDPYDRMLYHRSSSIKAEEEKNNIRSIVDKYDKGGCGKLEFDEFLGAIKESLNIKDRNYQIGFINQMRFMFDGIDMAGIHEIDKEEIITLFEKIKKDDLKYLTKRIFRGADINRTGKVSINELKKCEYNIGHVHFSQEEFEKECKVKFGMKKKELEYWEFYYIISGERIDMKGPDSDSYEGKLPIKSKCCILI